MSSLLGQEFGQIQYCLCFLNSLSITHSLRIYIIKILIIKKAFLRFWYLCRTVVSRNQCWDTISWGHALSEKLLWISIQNLYYKLQIALVFYKYVKVLNLMVDVDVDDEHSDEDCTSGLLEALPLFVTIMVGKSVLSTPFSVPAVYWKHRILKINKFLPLGEVSSHT